MSGNLQLGRLSQFHDHCTPYNSSCNLSNSRKPEVAAYTRTNMPHIFVHALCTMQAARCLQRRLPSEHQPRHQAVAPRRVWSEGERWMQITNSTGRKARNQDFELNQAILVSDGAPGAKGHLSQVHKKICWLGARATRALPVIDYGATGHQNLFKLIGHWDEPQLSEGRIDPWIGVASRI